MKKGQGKMKIISISNIKGGVAKTTTAATLAAGLNKRGAKVLMIDSDPQTNLTMCFMREPEDGTPSLYTVYKGTNTIDEAKIEIKPGLDILPGDFELCSADMEFFKQVGSLRLLSKALKAMENEYDYIIIDTPPNLGFLSLNAFMVSTCILTPMETGSFSLKATRLLKKVLTQIEEDAGNDVPVIGVLLTKYRYGTNVSKILEGSVEKAAELLGTTLFENKIRQATVVEQSQLARKDLFEYAPNAEVTKDYDFFIEEVLERLEEVG